MKAAKLNPMTARQLTKQADQAAKFLRAMSNGHRLRVLCLLLGGEMSVGELNKLIEVSQSVLSQHLALLRANGLVRTRRAAQTVYYAVTPGPATEVISVLYDAYCTSNAAAVPATDSRPRAKRRTARLPARSGTRRVRATNPNS